MSPSVHSDEKRIQLKNQFKPIHSYSGITIRRDPDVESILETRRLSIIENSYTRLAQVTSDISKISRSNLFEIHSSANETETEVTDSLLSVEDSKRRLPLPANELYNVELEDRLAEEHEGKRKEKKRKEKVIYMYI